MSVRHPFQPSRLTRVRLVSGPIIRNSEIPGSRNPVFGVRRLGLTMDAIFTPFQRRFTARFQIIERPMPNPRRQFIQFLILPRLPSGALLDDLFNLAVLGLNYLGLGRPPQHRQLNERILERLSEVTDIILVSNNRLLRLILIRFTLTCERRVLRILGCLCQCCRHRLWTHRRHQRHQLLRIGLVGHSVLVVFGGCSIYPRLLL